MTCASNLVWDAGIGIPLGGRIGKAMVEVGRGGFGGGVNLGICAGLAWVGGCSAVWDGVKNVGLCL